ncbi:ABC transporter permease [Amycolatopsis minnesotensis]|uniref:ABC transporter permease n=1 Tax=Amycolatopsis minnesotensis TaxID=337894 RepID=A0ABP5C700_9PSEU
MIPHRTTRVLGQLTRRVVTLVALLAITFFAVEVLPGDAVVSSLSQDASDAEFAARRAALGLDQPVLARFWHWIAGVFSGDLGTTARGQHIADLVLGRLPQTMLLGGTALVVTVLAALALGSLCVLRPGGRADRAIAGTAMVALALPEFAVATALVVVFAIWLRVLPAATGTAATSPVALVLPVIALALPQIGWNTRVVRAAFGEQLGTPHVDAAVLDGLSRRRILTHYLLPGAAPTIAAAAATSVGMVLGGAVTIEAIFNFPGLGSVLIDAVQHRDAPLVAAVVALTGALITVVLIGCDAVRAWAGGGR